ncbi:chromate efflux transporter [Paraconexibacter algicola]|uniref:Chromate transporter n=1 Tax=Paraconexibacter algicola TaxID=2133960 RepID=A0A2T4UJD3_9ACTN|nr:chromate efflux transporter [Paraconexibacter algicola]PTL59339.1 chromate transporter [Paraconexibacter algicola]
MPEVPLSTVLREWGRLGCIGFGGPPAHVALLRELCVERRRWIDDETFTDANAACGLLPGPASTQLAIFCAHRVAGLRGAVVGGLAFIVPGLLLLIGLIAVSLQDAPPDWVRGVSAAAGGAVVAVVLDAAWGLARGSVAGLRGAALARGIAYVAVAAVATVVVGPWVVLVLLGCGLVELTWRRGLAGGGAASVALPGLAALAVTTGAGALPALAWTALKVGALSYGGGFVIVPLMQADAVDAYGWMTDAEFLNAVAIGQLTPGPVVQTVAGVGYAAAGVGGALFAAAVAFAPSFLAVALGGARFERLRGNASARAFLDGAGPAAIGAILGAGVPLAGALEEPWQWAVAAAAAIGLLVLRQGVVRVLLGAAAVGAVLGLAGGPLPAL